MMSQKEAEQGGTTAVESAVSRPLSSHRSSSTILLRGEVDGSQIQSHVKAGNLYEIEHIHLPRRAPVQLRSIRVAMVCEKTETSVAVRYPSMESLRAFFNYSTRETHPALDKKFVMGATVAAGVLVRLVPAEVFSEKKSVEAFWLISCESLKDDVSVTRTCLSQLKDNGMLRWGIRRQVKYLGRHNDSSDGNAHNSSSRFVNGMEEGVSQDKQEKIGGGDEQNDDHDRQENNEGEEDDGEGIGDDSHENGGEGEGEGEGEEDDDDDGDGYEDEDEGEEKTKKSLKRKRTPFRNIGVIKQPRKKKDEIEKDKNSVTKKKKGRTRFREAFAPKDPKDRWSTERYKLAEENLLKVMKTKGATVEKPILRPQLRAEARKKIGDTGLLDHLLKHMAGKLAPGGLERFRRRHNPDGAMEYWLEGAELVHIRKEAGVTDPYWVPPPGWKPGDSPTQDPTCARELKLLWEDISKIKRDIELLATRTQLQEEIEKLRREVEEIASIKRKEENQTMTLASSDSDLGQKLDRLPPSSKRDFENAPVSLVEKAAKIGRLKSGFRVCKPQGTFLWPNISSSNSSSQEVVFQVEVPTPPSVSSSSALAPPQLPSLVKPVAEKRAVALTIVPKIQYKDGSSINLNDNDSSVISLTYQSSPATANTQPSQNPANDKKEYHACCPTSLALSPSKTAPDESSQG